MLSFQLTAQKDFMNKLLCGNLFHEFNLKEASIAGAVSYYVDGHVNQDYFEGEEKEEYLSFSDIRNNLFQMIKGKRTPLSFHMVLHLNHDCLTKIEEKEKISFKELMIANLVLNIRFTDGNMQLVSAVDYSNFSLDKDFEKKWDGIVTRILERDEISFK